MSEITDSYRAAKRCVRVATASLHDARRFLDDLPEPLRQETGEALRAVGALEDVLGDKIKHPTR